MLIVRAVIQITPFQKVARNCILLLKTWLTPTGTPHYCSAKAMEEYLEDYVNHFNIWPKCELSTTVTSIVYQGDRDKWRIEFDGKPSRTFDKVVMATGPHVQPTMPEIQGSHLFKGRILHSRAFKRSVP